MFSHSVAIDTSAPSSQATVKDYWQLLKPRVMALVVFTGLIGLLVSPQSVHPFQALMILLSIALGGGGAGALNMWYDRDIDARMERTKSRPLVRGAMHPDDALAFGLGVSMGAVMLMQLSGGTVAALLLAFTIFFYAVVYTIWLKRQTVQNIVIGGAAGALPPVVGYAATGADVTQALPWVLFLIIFLWTPAHFWALAILKRDEYEAAGVPMMPGVRGVPKTKLYIVFYALLTVGLSFALPMLDPLGWISGTAALVLGIWYLIHCHRLLLSLDNKEAGKCFGVSIAYLFLLFLCVGVDVYV
jgi:heme o synthase